MNQRIIALINAALIGLSAIAVGAYLYVALIQVSYPFSIEWGEANTFAHVLRVMQGQSVYTAPSYTFIPMIYTPLYYYAAAAVAAATGQIMLAMRLLSLLSSLLAFAMIYGICRARQLSQTASVLAVGLFAASFSATGYWFDLGRVDTLFVALLLAGYLLTIMGGRREQIAGVAAGAMFFLSFATKQTTVFAIPFALLHLVIARRWAKALWLGGTFGALWSTFILAMSVSTSGWFWIYAYRVPSAHPFMWQVALYDIWRVAIIPPFFWLILGVILAVAILATWRDWAGARTYLTFIGTFALPLAVASISSIAKQWGYINGLIALAAALAVIGAEGYHRVTTAAALRRGQAWVQPAILAGASAILAMQFFTLRYDPRSQIPTDATRSSGYYILDLLRSSSQPAFAPTSTYLLSLVGQPTHFDTASLGNLDLASQYNPALKALFAPYLAAISAQITDRSIQTVILPDAHWYDGVFTADNGYRCESLLDDRPPLMTLTGARSMLNRICRRE
jgi:hypothetical protein